jgi:hypothetical protein
MTLEWIARRLQMGTRGTLAQLLQAKPPSVDMLSPSNLGHMSGVTNSLTDPFMTPITCSA